jgi:hypothetical protein
MAGMRYRKAGQVAGAGLLRSYEATAMIEDAGWRRDMRGIMPAPELPTLRQPLLEAPGATGHATSTPPQVEPQRLSRQERSARPSDTCQIKEPAGAVAVAQSLAVRQRGLNPFRAGVY